MFPTRVAHFGNCELIDAQGVGGVPKAVEDGQSSTSSRWLEQTFLSASRDGRLVLPDTVCPSALVAVPKSFLFIEFGVTPP